MSSVNKVILIGNLGHAPTVTDVCTKISIATSENYTSKNGTKVDNTEWHDITFFGNLAKISAEFLKKGSKVYVEGKIKTNKWVGKDGTNKSKVEIIANTLQMLDSRKEEQTEQKYIENERVVAESNIVFDDVPF